MLRILFLLLLIPCELPAQERQVDPTWLHRYVPLVSQTHGDLSSATCHYKAIFGEGDRDNRTMRSVSRFGEATIDPRGSCQTVSYDRQEELYFVLGGKAVLHYGSRSYQMRANDFTYLAPGVKHSIENASNQASQVVIMGFKIPPSISITAPTSEPKS